MNKIEYCGYVRISKATARKLYNDGMDVRIMGCRVAPMGIFGRSVAGNVHSHGDFDCFCNHFSYYNCNHETGNYPAFYVKGNMLIHFSFADGSNPYIYRGTPLDCWKELQRWRKNWKISADGGNMFTLTEKHNNN